MRIGSVGNNEVIRPRENTLAIASAMGDVPLVGLWPWNWLEVCASWATAETANSIVVISSPHRRNGIALFIFILYLVNV
jgi:hypothetical protein